MKTHSPVKNIETQVTWYKIRTYPDVHNIENVTLCILSVMQLFEETKKFHCASLYSKDEIQFK